MAQMCMVHNNLFDDIEDVVEEVQNKDTARYIMYQLGVSEGARTADEYGEKIRIEDLRDTLIGICVEGGIVAVRPEAINENKIVLVPYNKTIEDEYFVGGYIAGVVSSLLGKPYVSKIADGKIVLTPSVLSLEELIRRKTVVNPISSAKKPVQSIELENGESYIIKDDVRNPANSFNILLSEIINNNKQGLVYTRIFPPKIEETYLKKQGVEVPIVWLTFKESSEEIATAQPTRYEFEIKRKVYNFLKNNDDGVVMLHGLEFLIQRNSFSKILNFVQDLRDMVSSTENILLIPIDPESLDGTEYKKLRLELKEYGN